MKNKYKILIKGVNGDSEVKILFDGNDVGDMLTAFTVSLVKCVISNDVSKEELLKVIDKCYDDNIKEGNNIKKGRKVKNVK